MIRFNLPSLAELDRIGSKERLNLFRQYISASRYNRLIIQQCLIKSAYDESFISETLDEVESKMKLAIAGFFETLPDERAVVLNKRRIPVPNRPEVIPGADRIVLKMVMPQS